MTSSLLRTRLIGKLFRRALRPASLRSRPALLALESRLTPTVSYPDIVMSRPIHDPLASSLPMGFDAFAPPVDTQVKVSAAAPIISEWTRSAGADHTIALTGHQFTSFGGLERGKDTDFIVYGLLDGSATTISHAGVLRADDARAAITLSADLLDNQMYLVWPRNDAGVGRPVAVNQANAQWVGPDKASPGEKVSIYGENLVKVGTDDAKVWIEPADGSSSFYSGWVEATGNPYKIDFTLPTGQALAAECKLWAHNFHGGRSGWSPPVTLSVRAPLPAAAGGKFDVSKYGAVPDDSAGDHDGILLTLGLANESLAANPGEAVTVFFPKGEYLIDKSIVLTNYHDIRFEGETSAGAPASVLTAVPLVTPTGKTYPPAVIKAENYVSNVSFRNFEFNDGGNLREGDGIFPTVVRLRGSTDVVFDNCKFVADAFRLTPLDLEGQSRRVTIKNCDFDTGFNIDLIGASQVRIEGCDFRAVYGAEQMIILANSTEISVTNCMAQDYDPNYKVDGKYHFRGFGQGRLLTAQGHFNENIYIAHNKTFGLAPKFEAIGVDGVNFVGLNDGEQILFEPLGGTVYGRPSAVDSDSVTLIGLDEEYLQSHLPHLTATVIDGRGIGQRRRVESIDYQTGKVTVTPDWSVIPDGYSQIAVAPAQHNVVIFENELKGKEEWVNPELPPPRPGVDLLAVHVASSGIQIGGVAHVIVVGNTIENVRQGVYMLPTQRNAPTGQGADVRPQFDTDYFNYIADNTMTRVTRGVSLATWNPGPGVSAVGYGSALLATVVRENTFAQMQEATTFNGTYRNYALGFETDFQYRAADLTIFEDNRYLPGPSGYTESTGLTGVWTFSSFSATTFDTIIRNNDFTNLPNSSTGVRFAPQSSVGLFDNQWKAGSTVYAGSLPGMVLEFPNRVVRLEWTGNAPTETDPTDVTVRNAGAGTDPMQLQDLWVVSSADWLVTWGIGVPVDEGSNDSLHVEIDPANAALLGDGVYTATVTITDGASAFAPVTVVMTVTNNPNVGPHGGILPDLRNDQIVQIEAENYDLGGNGVGFYDPNGDDHVTAISGGFAIVDPPVDNWYNHTVNVPADGWYRAELRAGRGGSVKLQSSGPGVVFNVPADGGWLTIRPGGVTEEFVYLSYGVQVWTLTVLTGSPDLDWLRLSPMKADGTAGIPLPYDAAAPVVSQFAATTVQAEHFDKGGIGVGYSGNWAGSTLSDFRAEEQVAVAQLNATAPPNYAVRGPADRWVGYTVDVATPGRYKVTFRASTGSFQDSLIALLTADGGLIGGEMEVPGMGDFTAFSEVSVTADFDTTGRKTLRLHFTGGTTQVDWLKFEPVALSLAGDEAPPAKVDVGDFKTVGTLFAVNAPGQITGLRFYMTAAEAEYISNTTPPPTHTLRLWRINDTYVEGGQTYLTNYNAGSIHPAAIEQVANAVTTSATASNGWVEVAFTEELANGLYMVSKDVFVNGKNEYYSFSTHQELYDAVGPARPSVLTVVAGVVADVGSQTPTKPTRIYSDFQVTPQRPNGFFWADVLFNPDY